MVDEKLDFEAIIRAIREKKKENNELSKRVRELERENKSLKKLLGGSVKNEIPKSQKLSGKQEWEALKEKWASLYPEQADLPKRIGDALKAWEVPFRGWKQGNQVLSELIAMAGSPKSPVPAKEIFNVITLMSRVDFTKYTEYVPTIRATEHISSKFVNFKNFFEREKIYYYPKATPANPNPNYVLNTKAFKAEYLNKKETD